MRSTPVLFMTLMATGLLSAPLPAYANVGPLQWFRGGGVVTPQSPHESIRMDSEVVTIRLRDTGYMVEAVFKLFNTGESATEWIGFPKWVGSRTGSYPGFIRFEGSVNGKEIPFDPETEHTEGATLSAHPSFQKSHSGGGRAMSETRQWLVGQVTFPGRAETTIRVTYEAPYAAGKGGWSNASYIYGTGHLWKGEIQQAIFVIDSTEIGGTEAISIYFEQGFSAMPVSGNVRPAVRPMLKNVVTYRLRDFKPHPEAFLRIQLQRSRFWRRANFVRQPPIDPRVPGPAPAPRALVPRIGEYQEQPTGSPTQKNR